MTPVVPCTVNNAPLIPGIPFISRNHNSIKKFNLIRCSTKQRPFPKNSIVTPSTSIRLFPKLRTNFDLQHKLKATGTDLAVEEAESPVSNEEPPSASAESSDKSEPSRIPAQGKRSKPTRKSEMPPVKPEDLVPGATFTGKVRSIQPFGAFVDFGAFTDGLVHVSQLSDGFVKDVGSVVSVGQEVTVRLVEANKETSRISLTMRDSDEKSNQRGPSDKSRPPRKGGKREDNKKASKFVTGQDLDGTVKNLARSGTFISLPEGEEGFLPQEEEEDGGFSSLMGGSKMEVGQEVKVRVLRISRGQVTLTMKKEEAAGGLDSKVTSGVVHTATSPFLLAFRKDKDIASFLDERKKEEESASIEEKVEVTSDVAAPVEEVSTSDEIEKEAIVTDSVAAEEVSEAQIDDVAKDEVEVTQSSVVEDVSSPTITEDEKVEASVKDNSTLTSAIEEIEVTKEVENVIEEVAGSKEDDVIAKDENEETSTEDNSSVTSSTIEDTEAEVVIETVAPDTNDEVPSASLVEEERVDSPPEEATKENEVSNEVEKEVDDTQAKGETDAETSGTEEVTSATQVEEEKVDSAPEELAESKVENIIETPVAPVEEKEAEPAPEEKVAVTASSEESSEPFTNGSTAKATISPALVKQLREESGAGMMDCKKALSETGGDLEKAQEFLRKKGLASADKKASRATAEGRIGSYIHDSRIGVLIEVNCETDFVSRGEIFKELVDDLAMQVAACPQVQYLATDDVDKEIIEKERAIEMQKEDLLSRPEQIREKIVDGRIRKRLEELALLEQPYIKNDKMVVKDWVKQTIATIGENIKVKRFVRFNLGEGLEKKSQDFAAEVAAQTAAKSAPPPVKDQPAAVTEEKPDADKPKVAVSAALVKQLRDETGAGMMDCKKALAETDGDLEKAQEYLRKKGLSTADKKSSRLAAEGRIGAYIHDARIGVLIEINCETDFVARGERFKELVDDLAMQVVACPQVQYVSIEDIPAEMVAKEKEMEMQREDLQSKPESIREKIVEGRVSKRLGELALLEQPYVKDDSLLVKDLVKQTVAGLGENIKVRRFVKFTIGEEVESPKTEDEA